MNKIVVMVLILLALGGGIYFYQKRIEPSQPIACTEEAKICPDGTAVGRTGPNCEFAACPTPQVKEETVAALNQKILNEGIFITPLEVVSDSRCPIDVTCIWAGEVSVKVKLEKGSTTTEVVLKEGGSTTFEGISVFLVSVAPANNSKNPLKKEDYRFTFN